MREAKKKVSVQRFDNLDKGRCPRDKDVKGLTSQFLTNGDKRDLCGWVQGRIPSIK